MSILLLRDFAGEIGKNRKTPQSANKLPGLWGLDCIVTDQYADVDADETNNEKMVVFKMVEEGAL